MEITNLTNNETLTSIANIHLYNEHGIWHTFSDAFTPCYVDGDKATDYGTYDKTIVALELGTTRRARSVNFSKTDCFLIKIPVRYSFEDCYDLYIHSNYVESVERGDKIVHQDENQTCYHDVATIRLKKALVREYHIESEEFDSESKINIPEGARIGSNFGTKIFPVYDVIHPTEWQIKKRPDLDGKKILVKRWVEEYTEENLLIHAHGRCYSKIEYSEKKQREKELADEINAKRIFYKEISHYEIEKLLRFYDVTPKKGV